MAYDDETDDARPSKHVKSEWWFLGVQKAAPEVLRNV